MKHTPPPLTQDLLEAFAASAVAWAVRLLGAVLHPNAQRRRERLGAFIARVERFVEHIIFLQAVRTAGPPPRRTSKPGSAPPGFRRVRRRPTLFWKIARIRADRRASLADRIARLLDVLAHPAPYIARFIERIGKGLRSHLIPLAPPTAALSADAPCASVLDDTS